MQNKLVQKIVNSVALLQVEMLAQLPGGILGGMTCHTTMLNSQLGNNNDVLKIDEIVQPLLLNFA